MAQVDVGVGVRVELGAATDVGRVRTSNEDALVALEREGAGQALIAVADGMGGHQAGEVASALATETLTEAFSRVTFPISGADRRALLAEAVRGANRNVWQAAAASHERNGMGTTLVCALVSAEGVAAIANVGDSRAYLVSGGQARLVTHDHSWVAEQVRAGALSERDAESSPYRHVLTRSLGVAEALDVDLYELALRPGDALVLCSDGVSGYLDTDDFARLVGQAASAQDAADRLVHEAVARGGADNATVVVARLVG